MPGRVLKRKGRMDRKSMVASLSLCAALSIQAAWSAPSSTNTQPTAPTPNANAARHAASQSPPPGTGVSTKASNGKSSAAVSKSRYHPGRFPKRAELHYGLFWGVDSLSVKWAESGEIIRFNYRVLDPDKARALNDKRAEPSLIAPRAGVKLVVPSMEKIGQLRQSADPEEGKSYWMAFSNKGRLVKRGDRVNIVIGTFQADGLIVD